MSVRFDAPRPPILIETAYDDPERIEALVRANAPYWPILRYVKRPEEMAAVSRSSRLDPVVLPPWFRGDWADGEPLIEGADVVLSNPAFIESARKLFDAEVVVPTHVYVNLMAPMRLAGEGHIDVPAFRGIDRARHPIWLLQQMLRSGLFSDWQIDIATAVSWLYDGVGGDFDYWPGGPSSPPERLASPLTNRAVVGDNDFMFHRVAAIGSDAPEKMMEASLDAELMPSADGSGDWVVLDGGSEAARYAADTIRVSVSWKAEVYADEEARRVRTEHRDDLDLERVIDAFMADLSDRGLRIDRPENPLDAPEFTAALAEVYTLPDLVYPTPKETAARARKTA